MTDAPFSPTKSGCCAPEGDSCCSGKVETSSWADWQRWKPWVMTPWTVVFVVPVLVFVWDQARTLEVIEFAVRAFASTLPYVVFAVLLIAWLKAAGAEGYIAKAFEGREWQAICLAALFGGLAPFCSCEVIPFVAGLLAVRAPLSAIMAFWLSSPLIDPPTVLITAAALGWSFAIGKAVFAVSLGLFGGLMVAVALRVGWFGNPVRVGGPSTASCCGASAKTGKPVWRFWSEPERVSQFRTELKINALFLAKWLALAYVLEALLVTYVPATLIAGIVGGEGVVPIFVAALVGMPAYLNSYVAPPLLAGLVEQGMSNGAAMSFMIAGAVSSIPAMAAVWSLVRPQVFAAYLGLGLFGAVTSGLIFQWVV
ncbi:permease [Roseibium algae]|uniref:Permease n=1 Tax=Roseibium algae TaxID=3123038 RepID=A0ABU8TEM2_9HYPH